MKYPRRVRSRPEMEAKTQLYMPNGIAIPTVNGRSNRCSLSEEARTVCSRRIGLRAANVRPDLAGADVRADVGADAGFEERGEVVAERGESAFAIGRAAGRLLFASRGRGGASFAEDHRGDALPDEALRVAIAEQRVVRVVVNVDEAGRDDEARGVDGPLRRFASELTDGGDSVAGEGKVGDVAGVARAVGEAAVTDEDVVVRGEEREGGEEGEEWGTAHSGHYTASETIEPHRRAKYCAVTHHPGVGEF